MQERYALLTIGVDGKRKKEGSVQAHPSLSCDSERMVPGNVSVTQQPREKHTVRIRGGVNCAGAFSFRKEVIQPQVLLRLPCYDFTPIMNYTLGGCLLAVGSPTSSATHFRDVTGGVYKARERIHRGMLIHDY